MTKAKEKRRNGEASSSSKPPQGTHIKIEKVLHAIDQSSFFSGLSSSSFPSCDYRLASVERAGETNNKEPNVGVSLRPAAAGEKRKEIKKT
jgi:hypothetical protein